MWVIYSILDYLFFVAKFLIESQNISVYLLMLIKIFYTIYLFFKNSKIKIQICISISFWVQFWFKRYPPDVTAVKACNNYPVLFNPDSDFILSIRVKTLLAKVSHLSGYSYSVFRSYSSRKFHIPPCKLVVFKLHVFRQFQEFFNSWHCKLFFYFLISFQHFESPSAGFELLRCFELISVIPASTYIK